MNTPTSPASLPHNRYRIRLVSPMLPTTGDVISPAPRPTRLDGVKVGLLANGKVNGDRLLAAIGAILRDEHGASIGPLVVKPHPSLPMAFDTADTFTREVAVVLSAIGD